MGSFHSGLSVILTMLNLTASFDTDDYLILLDHLENGLDFYIHDFL